MEELIKKLKEAGKLETIKSEEDLRAAAKELGYSDEDIDNCMSEIPLDDDALEQAAGGNIYKSVLNPFVQELLWKEAHPWYVAKK